MFGRKFVRNYVLNNAEKINLLKLCGPPTRLCFFTFGSNALKQFNTSLTTIDTFS